MKKNLSVFPAVLFFSTMACKGPTFTSPSLNISAGAGTATSSDGTQTSAQNASGTGTDAGGTGTTATASTTNTVATNNNTTSTDTSGNTGTNGTSPTGTDTTTATSSNTSTTVTTGTPTSIITTTTTTTLTTTVTNVVTTTTITATQTNTLTNTNTQTNSQTNTQIIPAVPTVAQVQPCTVSLTKNLIDGNAQFGPIYLKGPAKTITETTSLTLPADATNIVVTMSVQAFVGFSAWMYLDGALNPQYLIASNAQPGAVPTSCGPWATHWVTNTLHLHPGTNYLDAGMIGCPGQGLAVSFNANFNSTSCQAQ